MGSVKKIEMCTTNSPPPQSRKCSDQVSWYLLRDLGDEAAGRWQRGGGGGRGPPGGGTPRWRWPRAAAAGRARGTQPRGGQRWGTPSGWTLTQLEHRGSHWNEAPCILIRVGRKKNKDKKFFIKSKICTNSPMVLGPTMFSQTGKGTTVEAEERKYKAAKEL